MKQPIAAVLGVVSTLSVVCACGATVLLSRRLPQDLRSRTAYLVTVRSRFKRADTKEIVP